MNFLGTTILGIRLDDDIAIGGDGQITLGDMAMKHTTQKVQKLYHGKVLAGFAGSAADSMTLLTRFEKKLEEYSGNLSRSAVELAKDWRMDKYLRNLEALLLVMDKTRTLIISGNGEIIEPDDQVASIGSGSGYALAAAKAYIDAEKKPKADEMVSKSLKIAANICIYTNSNITVLTL
ncbi:MAG: ATP-dependent protease subunit HslV [Candidatus Zixiibacteriota bacterium]